MSLRHTRASVLPGHAVEATIRGVDMRTMEALEVKYAVSSENEGDARSFHQELDSKLAEVLLTHYSPELTLPFVGALGCSVFIRFCWCLHHELH